MALKPNRIREKLSKGEVVTGTVLCTWSATVMEVAGYAGLDFVRLDCEHSWRRDESAEHILRAAALVGIETIVRVDRDDPYMIRKALEIGAAGIILPDCHNAEEAAATVHAAKFQPQGGRGFVRACWASGWGAKACPEYVEWGNTQPMIGVMIENTDAAANVEEILAVDGLDFVLFGPFDFSMSLGLGYPDKNHPKVQEAIQRSIAAAKNVGKPLMLGTGTNPEEIKKYMDMGVSMFELGADTDALFSVWEKGSAKVHELAASRK